MQIGLAKYGQLSGASPLAEQLVRWGAASCIDHKCYRNAGERHFTCQLEEGILGNLSEGRMWYEMSQKKDQVFYYYRKTEARHWPKNTERS